MARLNNYTLNNNIIYFNNGIIIDQHDLKLLKDRTPYVMKTGQAAIKVKGIHKKLHRLFMNTLDPKIQVDHINGNQLDNRRSNLRCCNNQLNSRNRSNRINSRVPYKGVTVTKEDNYMARIQIDIDVRLCLGTYTTPEEAALIYDQAALLYFGTFAKFNFPEIAKDFYEGH